ncbi:hypothetical protein SELMODRAFT_131706, partial [Selaginella moellendorffii]
QRCMAQLEAQHVDKVGKPTLILDLDGTLIATSRQAGLHAKLDFVVEFDPQEQPVWVCKRPGLDDFLSKASQLFEVVVFSLGKRAYVEKMREKIDPSGSLVAFWLSRDSCSGSDAIKEYKDLNSPSFGRDLRRVVWVDDFRDSFRMNLESGIVVPMFRNSSSGNDRVLMDLWPHLETLATYGPDVDVRAALLSLPLPLLESNLARAISRPKLCM